MKKADICLFHYRKISIIGSIITDGIDKFLRLFDDLLNWMNCHMNITGGFFMKRKIILAGGSGFLGKELSAHFIKLGYEVIILSRSPRPKEGAVQYTEWDAKTLGVWTEVLENSEALINLTGKSINCIYTKKNKEEILRSRSDSVRILHKAVQNCIHPPKVFIQVSAIGIYGNTTSVCDESATHGSDFMTQVCEEWEETFFATKLPTTRQVVLRVGFVLGHNGGALEPLVKLTKYYLGGTIGSGKQYISWIHMQDLCRMFATVIENQDMTGIFNATAPHPVTNKEFMRSLRMVLKKGWSPPVPVTFVWLGAYLIMRADPDLALSGRNVIPQRFLDSGFIFHFPELGSALRDLVVK